MSDPSPVSSSSSAPSDASSEFATAVIIVAFDSSNTIRQCVESCRSDLNVHTIVVIDNSTDTSTHDAIKDLAGVRYVPSDNIGFSMACNLGASLSTEPWLAFINPDVTLQRGVSELAQSMSGRGFAAGAGKLSSGPNAAPSVNCRDAFSLRRELVAVSTGPTRTYTPKFARSVEGTWTRVGQLAGAFIVMRRSVFDAISGFDEQFELYYDDVDLARRLEPHGGSGLLHVPFGYHVGGASSRSVPEMAFVVATTSRVRFIRKWHPKKAVIAVPMIALLEWTIRSLTRQPEGQVARNSALRAQFQELRRPGSVQVLL